MLGSPLPLIDLPSTERIIWMFQKTLWGKKVGKKQQGKKLVKKEFLH